MPVPHHSVFTGWMPFVAWCRNRWGIELAIYSSQFNLQPFHCHAATLDRSFTHASVHQTV